MKVLPAGRGFVCLDTKTLPHQFRQVLATQVARAVDS